MRRDVAIELLALCFSGTDLVKRSIEKVKTAGPGAAAQHYESYMFPVWASLVVGVIGPILDEYPDLAPHEAASGDPYDPVNFYLPKAMVVESAQLIARVRKTAFRLQRILEAADLSSREREHFARYVELLARDVGQAEFSIKQQHPDFAEPDAAETIPGTQERDDE